MIGIIAAVSANGVIGITGEDGKGKLPWDYPADMKYFRETTKDGNIIFGRKTFESIGKPLPRRRNIVISRTKVDVPKVETYPSVAEAMARLDQDHADAVRAFEAPHSDMLVVRQNTWFAGGTRIYEEGMSYANEIHLTTTPDVITQAGAVRFPFINPRQFEVSSWTRLDPVDDTLRLFIYKRV
jgi:dihydrofolate reductase